MKQHTEKEQKMRSRITKKAFEIMSKKGIEQVSMREIAQSIGVTKPVLYYYFKNKEDLCRNIIEQSVCHLHGTIKDAHDSGVDLESLAVVAMKTHHDFMTTNPKMAKFILHLISYSVNARKATDKAFTDFKEEKQKHHAKMMAVAEEKGVIPKGSGEDLALLFSALMSQTIMSITDPNIKYDEGYPERMIKIIFKGVRAYYKEQEESKNKGSKK